MYKQKYSGDIKDYITKMKALNNIFGMSGVIFRKTIKQQLLKDLQR
jgi:cell division FtsZ-interacting protein ZapD